MKCSSLWPLSSNLQFHILWPEVVNSRTRVSECLPPARNCSRVFLHSLKSLDDGISRGKVSLDHLDALGRRVRYLRSSARPPASSTSETKMHCWAIRTRLSRVNSLTVHPNLMNRCISHSSPTRGGEMSIFPIVTRILKMLIFSHSARIHECVVQFDPNE